MSTNEIWYSIIVGNVLAVSIFPAVKSDAKVSFNVFSTPTEKEEG